MRYLKNISFIKLKENKRSYSTKSERITANLATIQGDFLTVYTFAPAVIFTTRYNMSAKKFIELEKSTEIKRPTFEKHYKRLSMEASERINEANEASERVQAARVKVQAKKDWLKAYLSERGLSLNDLKRHKVANLYGFKLAHRFDVKQSDLRKVFKTMVPRETI